MITRAKPATLVGACVHRNMPEGMSVVSVRIGDCALLMGCRTKDAPRACELINRAEALEQACQIAALRLETILDYQCLRDDEARAVRETKATLAAAIGVGLETTAETAP